MCFMLLLLLNIMEQQFVIVNKKSTHSCAYTMIPDLRLVWGDIKFKVKIPLRCHMKSVKLSVIKTGLFFQPAIIINQLLQVASKFEGQVFIEARQLAIGPLTNVVFFFFFFYEAYLN